MSNFLSNIGSIFSTAAVLDYLGLERKRSREARMLTYTSLVLSGAALGAVAALLLAPKAGRDLRADVGERARQISSRVAAQKARVGGYSSPGQQSVGSEPVSGL